MANRTFKQLGMAYGTEPLTIIARIDNVVVYEGTIPTLNQPVQTDPNANNFAAQLFTWELDTAFSGTVDMSITIAGEGCLFLTETLANYVQIQNPDSDPDDLKFSNSGADVFGRFYLKQMSDYMLGDPLTNVKIDDKPELTNPTASSSGQVCWCITTGSTFSATVNIAPNAHTPAKLD